MMNYLSLQNLIILSFTDIFQLDPVISSRVVSYEVGRLLVEQNQAGVLEEFLQTRRVEVAKKY